MHRSQKTFFYKLILSYQVLEIKFRLPGLTGKFINPTLSRDHVLPTAEKSSMSELVKQEANSSEELA